MENSFRHETSTTLEKRPVEDGSSLVMPLLPATAENSVSINIEPSTSKKLEYELEEEEKSSLRECGINGCRPAFIQGCASIKTFTFFCCALVTVQGVLSGGYLPSVISTLEKRYDMPSGLVSLIPSSYEIGNLITVIFVSYLGTRRHIPRWMATGVLLMGAGSILFSVPHFMTDKYEGGTVSLANGNLSDLIQDTICQPSDPTRTGSSILEALITFKQTHNLKKPSRCQSGDDQNIISTTNRMYIGIFIAAQVLMGSGGSPIFTLGSTYIDDHVKKENSAMYLGVLYTCIALGPVLGFLLGGFLLRIHVDTLYLDDKSYNVDISSPNWIGAWWGGFLFCGCLLLSLAVPFFAFPKSLSKEKAKVLEADKEKQVGNDHFANMVDRSKDSVEKSDKEYGQDIRGIPRALASLLSNNVYIVTSLGACMELVIVSGFCVFLPKYLETQFDVSKADANVLIGGIAMPGACFGILVGGWLLKKLELQPIGAVRLLITCNLVCLTMFSALIVFGCDNIKIAGATTDYHNSPSIMSGLFRVNLTSPCNMGCGCSENQLEPICGSDGLTYISPCHAGCKQFDHTGAFHNLQANFSDCSCIPHDYLANSAHEISVKPLATTGACPRQCDMLIPFIVLVFIMSFTVAVAQMPILMLTMRTVALEERSLAIGLQFVFFRLLAYIPAPIVFGNLIDTTCLLWRTPDCKSSSGGCLLYDIEMFRFKYIGIGAGFKVIALLLFSLDYWLIRRRMRVLQSQEQAELPSTSLSATQVMAISLTCLRCSDHKPCGKKCRRKSDHLVKRPRHTSFTSLPGDLANGTTEPCKISAL